MFGAGEEFEVFRRTVALKAAYYAQTHASVHVRIFPVCFLTASPPGVTENVDCRGPERQAFIFTHFALTTGLGVFGACLVGDGRENLFYKVVVKRCGHAYARREHRRQTVAAYAVEGFAPPLEGRYSQALDGWRGIHHQFGLFFKSEARAKVGCPFFRRQIRVLIGQRLCVDSNLYEQ